MLTVKAQLLYLEIQHFLDFASLQIHTTKMGFQRTPIKKGVKHGGVICDHLFVFIYLSLILVEAI